MNCQQKSLLAAQQELIDILQTSQEIFDEGDFEALRRWGPLRGHLKEVLLRTSKPSDVLRLIDCVTTGSNAYEQYGSLLLGIAGELFDQWSKGAIGSREALLEKRIEHFEQLSHTDELTGILNRRGFEVLGQAALLHARENGSPVSLLFIDLDHFKQVNDQYGHAAGDLLLRDFGQALAAAARQGDVVARHGGDEFVLLLVNCVLSDARAYFLPRLNAMVNDLLQKPRFTTGIATNTNNEQHKSLAQLVQIADRCMYEAKQAGSEIGTEG